MANNVYWTTITDPDGTKKSGFIQDGRTYYAEGGAIKNGASVTAKNGQTYTKGAPSSGSSSGGSSGGSSSSGSGGSNRGGSSGSSGNTHAAYLDNTYAGGSAKYAQDQQARYYQALSSGNTDLINRLKADAQRVGYTLDEGIKTAAGYVPSGGQKRKNAEGQDVYVYDGYEYLMNNPYGNITSGQTVPGAYLSTDNIYNAYLEQIKAQEEAARAAMQAQIDQAVGKIEANRGSINQGSEDALRQAYILNLQNQRSMPQMMAAQGYTGGASESANLQLQAAYESAANQIAREKQNALNSLDADIANVKASGDISLADLAGEYSQRTLDAYQQALAAQQQQEQWQREYELQQAQAEQSAAATAYQQRYQLALQRAEMGDFEGLREFGVPESSIATMQANYAAQQAAKRKSGGSSGGSKLTFNQVRDLLDEGVRTPVILDAYKYYTGQDYTEGGADNERFETLVKNYYDSTNAIAKSKGRAPTLEEIQIAAQSLRKQGVPERLIQEYIAAYPDAR